MKNIHFLQVAITNQKDSQLVGKQTRRRSFKLKYHITNNKQLVIIAQINMKW
jgi:hypothetical protein